MNLTKLVSLALIIVIALTGCKTNPLDEKGDSANKNPTGSAQATPRPVSGNSIELCTFDNPGSLDTMPKQVIELAPAEAWFHRVFNTRLFNEANNWGGADNWFMSLALGPNSGGSWTSMSNPGQIVYRATSTSTTWCLGLLTTKQYKSQFLGDVADVPIAVNIRITPNTLISVRTATGKTISQATSDGGDITIILPDEGIVVIAVAFTTAAPTFESLVWWGPYDRSADINTIDARE